jgi:hypothetical protein
MLDAWSRRYVEKTYSCVGGSFRLPSRAARLYVCKLYVLKNEKVLYSIPSRREGVPGVPFGTFLLPVPARERCMLAHTNYVLFLSWSQYSNLQ